MAYIGKQPLVGNYISCDSLSASATTTYNLTSNGTAVFPTVPQNCLVSLNGVVQAPVTSYTISGATIVFSTVLSTTDTIDYVTVLGSTLNIGTPSNDTVGLDQLSATGTPSATTFLRGDNAWATPAADIAWQSVQTTSFTAVAGRAYPVNTTSASITVTLPASPTAGDQIQIVDYAGTADTNAIVINPNGNKLEGGTADQILTGDREGVILTYIDSTQGWICTSGINEGTDALEPNTYSIDFLVVAGGGGGGKGFYGGGAGAGGYRTSTQTVSTGTAITVTVGDGGAGSSSITAKGSNGSNSSISGTGLTTITSAGGGGGGSRNNETAGGAAAGANGGSGGGASYPGPGSSGGTGNTPSTSPSQGNDGGSCTTSEFGASGGGAGAVGGNGTNSPYGAVGGNGTASSITGSSVTRAGGGGGGASTVRAGGTGGGGSGGNDSPSTAATNGTANSGGGGGGGGDNGNPSGNGGSGGKGVVILSMLTSKYSGTTTGSPTVTTSGSNTILQFNGDGSYTT